LPYADLSLTDRDEDAHPGKGPGALGRLRRRWRWWMAPPLVLVVLAIGAVVRVSADVVWPEQVLDAAQLVDVSVDDAPGPRLTGTFLTIRRRRHPTALQWLVALAPGGADTDSMAPASIDHFDPVQSALLMGAGVSPGRGSTDELGLSADVRDDRTATADPAIVLYVADVVSPQDLAAGRRVLALGGLGPGFALTCPDDGLATYQATRPPPDVVVIAKRCPDAGPLRRSGAELVEATSIFDAMQSLARG
jgi:hypothetical protein